MSRRGRPRTAEQDEQRCVAITPESEWKKKNRIEQRCPFEGRYVVDGSLLCLHHARCEVMAIGFERGFVTRAVAAHVPGQRVKKIEK